MSKPQRRPRRKACRPYGQLPPGVEAIRCGEMFVTSYGSREIYFADARLADQLRRAGKEAYVIGRPCLVIGNVPERQRIKRVRL